MLTKQRIEAGTAFRGCVASLCTVGSSGHIFPWAARLYYTLYALVHHHSSSQLEEREKKKTLITIERQGEKNQFRVMPHNLSTCQW